LDFVEPGAVKRRAVVMTNQQGACQVGRVAEVGGAGGGDAGFIGFVYGAI